jgi:hypothetical protein
MPWLIFLSVGCVDLTPAWEKANRDIVSPHTGGSPSTGGNGGGEMADVGSGGILGDVDDGSGGTPEDATGGGQPSGGTTEIGGQGGTATGGMGSGGSATGGMGSGGSATGGMGSGGTATGGMGSGGSATGGMGSGGMVLGGASGGAMGGTGGSQSCAAPGKLDSGICWYFGALGSSCSMTCAIHGGTSPKAASYIGSNAQGGSATSCARLLGFFGNSWTIVKATRADGNGFGCHVYPVDKEHPYWLASPDFKETVKSNDVRIICGCLH